MVPITQHIVDSDTLCGTKSQTAVQDGVKSNETNKFYVHGSVHRESVSIIVQQDTTIYSLLYFCKVLYMFRVVIPPIIRSTYNRNYSIWH